MLLQAVGGRVHHQGSRAWAFQDADANTPAVGVEPLNHSAEHALMRDDKYELHIYWTTQACKSQIFCHIALRPVQLND
jgi:hypothetical protein